MRFMSCLNKMTICHNCDFHYNRPILRFPRPQLESLQGSCSLIILKLLTLEKRFVGKKWKANGWLKGPGVCHHNAAGWSSPETMGQTKVEGRIFLAKYTSLKNNMMHETVLPDALDADMGKLPSRKSEIRSACCRRACDLSSQGNSSRILRWLSHHGAEKMRRLKKKSPQRKCPTLPCSHVPMETYGFVSLYQSPSLETFFGSFKSLCFQSTWWHHTAALGQCLFGSVVSLCTNFMAAYGNLGCHEGCLWVLQFGGGNICSLLPRCYVLALCFHLFDLVVALRYFLPTRLRPRQHIGLFSLPKDQKKHHQAVLIEDKSNVRNST